MNISASRRRRRWIMWSLSLSLLAAVMLAGFLYASARTGSDPNLAVNGETAANPQPADPAPAPAEPEPEPEPPAPQLPARPDPQLPGSVAIMIENSVFSRPQAGLEKADLVYEMEAEFGITRFLAFFNQEAAARIGPVRSARMGFYEVAASYGLPYAHVGGSYEALRELGRTSLPVLNLDEISTCGDCFWRTPEREPPHNVYTSTDRLISRALAAGWPLQPLFRFPEGEPMEGGKAVPEIAFHWGPKSEHVVWRWNGTRYQRTQSGEPHLMESGAQVEADNVVLLFTRYVWDPMEPPEGLNRITIVGNGTGYLYRDGQAYPINWTKSARDQHFQFATPDEKPVRLTVGQTWIEVLKGPEYVALGSGS